MRRRNGRCRWVTWDVASARPPPIPSTPLAPTHHPSPNPVQMRENLLYFVGSYTVDRDKKRRSEVSRCLLESLRIMQVCVNFSPPFWSWRVTHLRFIILPRVFCKPHNAMTLFW